MNRSPLFVAGIIVLLSTAGFADEIRYVEDFALATDRIKALQQLIPGTEDHYFYHCLHNQNTEQFDQVEQLLGAWIKRYGYTPRVREIQNRQALQQHDAIVKRLSSIQGVMPNKIKEKFDTHMRGIYSLIRQHRNEAGHPTGVSKSRDETLPLFYLFVSQLKLVFELIQWLDEDKRL